MPDFRSALSTKQRIFFDGGLGTMLMAQGMPAGLAPELFGLEHPDCIASIHKEYAAAGAMVITTNTFGASSFKLPADHNPAHVNRHFAELARRSVPEHIFIAGDIGPSGVFMPPLGEVSFERLVQAFKEQAAGLAEGGADLIIIETQFDLAEARAAVIASRQACNLPVAVSMTFEGGISLTGTPPRVFLETMLNLGVEMIGVNCSSGPEDMLPIVASMMAGHNTPVLVQPNAGLPYLKDGRTIYPMGAEEFASAMKPLADLGVQALGGCCGTTPEHLRQMIAATENAPVHAASNMLPYVAVTSRSESVILGPGHKTACIGERINPTGKAVLTKDFQENRFSAATKLAQEQIDHGAAILDVNVGAPMVDEIKFLPSLTKELSARFTIPLCLDSPNSAAIAAALPFYPASCLINSISGEEGKMEALGPLCAQFGTPFILLPLKGGKLPATIGERIDIIEELLQHAEKLNIPRRLILVDALALTVSSKPDAALQCLEVIRYCNETLSLPTVVGLSNISFGLPARELLNASFLGMAAALGLRACIANPASVRLQESMAATELLLNRDRQAEQFIGRFSDWKPESSGLGAATAGKVKKSKSADLYQAVLDGDEESLPKLLQEKLDNKISPYAIVDQILIPAITEVGERYHRKEYFLPQLIRSAETMQSAFDQLEPLMMAEHVPDKKLPLILLATVEGDIHDIGKNIVALMLKNHGFAVLDMGKNVKAEDIVNAAVEKGAALIGLSALMTTTMVHMAETVKLVKKANLPIKIMVGGAVVSEDFSKDIGADGFSEDAVGAVKLAKKLLQ